MNPTRFLPLLLLAVACSIFTAGGRGEGPVLPAGGGGGGGAPAALRAGVYAVDIAPPTFPVRVNGMFTERSADRVIDPLLAKAMVLDDGATRLVFCVVDTCMMDRGLIDAAKEMASTATGVPAHRMLVSATHTHSAPSAMGCLGSRVDPGYAAFLPGKIAEAIVGAVERLQPARIGWTVVDDWDHTFNRRWLRRPDRLMNDPFGQPTVRAHMHPGHQSPDVTGPSGPVDPGLSLLAVQTAAGQPLAVLANYSMHYIGSELLSSDYFGRFAGYLAKQLGAGPEFVGMMSQGTSGDLWAGDYGAPAHDLNYDTFAGEMAERAARAISQIEWRDRVPLKMAERTLTLKYRTPDAGRLAWAVEMMAGLGDRLPSSQPEIYAAEAIHLHERQQSELKLQAASVGGFGITALPNEVVALTGLKIKARSPLVPTMNIELANGADGYIPPPEQHHLGGYITWPARTAGLEVEAELRIVETVLSLLEEVSGKPRRDVVAEHGPYAQAILADHPLAYWRLDEMTWPTVTDAGPHGRSAVMEPGVAVYLPGAGSGTGHRPAPALVASHFSGPQINRAVHCAGGRVTAEIELGDAYTAEFWVWNGLPTEARAVTGYCFSRGVDGDAVARGEHLGIGGTHLPETTGRLFLFNGNERNEVLAGRTVLATKQWHHVVLVRDGASVRVHLDGAVVPEISGEYVHTVPTGEAGVFLGGRNDRMFGLEGKLDEVALYGRALSPDEIAAHYQASGLHAPVAAAPVAAPVAPVAPVATPALSPRESMALIRVPDGYEVELVAAEPLTADPVAIDWDASGRLWVVEMADYPLGLDGRGQAGGRIRVLSDADGDGRYDKAVVFAEGLNFPTGLLTWRDGVIVTAAPEVLWLRDTDGDGVADVREVLLTGLMEGNQQLRANGLRWGLDNWVYCAAGGHHGDYGVGNALQVSRTGQRVEVGSRDFRFRPDTGELEPASGPSQFGRNRDDWGRWFGTQNSRPLWHYVLADHYVRRNPHASTPDVRHQVVVPLNPKVWPLSVPEKRFHSFENSGHFTSACGGMIYRDAWLFPAGGVHAFTCEPFHNLIQHNVLSDDGISFAATRDPAGDGPDFFASEDRWCRPVMARTGPDGALWVVDMYRYMIEHPDWLPEDGRAELLPHYRLGDDKGRIYRVLPAGGAVGTPLRLDADSPAGLVAALDSANGWQRDKAHQLLLWHDHRAAVPALMEMAVAHANPLARVQALGVLDGLRALDPEIVLRALADRHAGVRENALRLAETRGTAEVVAAAALMTADPDPKVRLQLALTLGEWESPVAGAALGRLMVAGQTEALVRAAVMSSALLHIRALAAAVAVDDGGAVRADATVELMDIALAVNDREALALLVGPVFAPADGIGVAAPERFAVAAGFLRSLGRRGRTVEELVAVDDELTARLRGMEALVWGAWTVVNDRGASVDDRSVAISFLGLVSGQRAAVLRVLTDWLLEWDEEGDLRPAAVAALVETGDEAVPGILLQSWASASPRLQEALFAALLTRETWTQAFLGGLPEGMPLVLDAARQARLLQHPSAEVRTLAAKRLAPTPLRAEVLGRFQPALQLAGDPEQGRATFVRLCINCHREGEEGVDVGPNLQSVVAHPPEKLLTNILAPNVDVQPGYHAYQVRMRDGTDVYGLVASETGNSLTFKAADGTTRVILRQDVVSLQSTGLSLMPEGLEAGLTPQDLADLISYLKRAR